MPYHLSAQVCCRRAQELSSLLYRQPLRKSGPSRESMRKTNSFGNIYLSRFSARSHMKPLHSIRFPTNLDESGCFCAVLLSRVSKPVLCISLHASLLSPEFFPRSRISAIAIFPLEISAPTTYVLKSTRLDTCSWKPLLLR